MVLVMSWWCLVVGACVGDVWLVLCWYGVGCGLLGCWSVDGW